MSKLICRLLQASTVLAVSLVANPINAEPIHPFAEPIALGDRAIDVDDTLSAAFDATPWTLSRENDALYLGNLSWKGTDVQVRIAVVDNAITMTLDSVTESGCRDNCKDLGEKRAMGWLITLRRNITYELTLRVRDSLQ